jgi:uncharacterized phage protein gp47/JayE
MQFNDAGAQIDSWSETRKAIADAFKELFGDDFAVDDEDSAVGKAITILADVTDALNQKVQYAVSAYNPNAATGVALKNLLKMTGLTANEGLYSTASLTLYTSALGTKVYAGDKVRDPNNTSIEYIIDADVTIPPNGSVTVSATCDTIGYQTAAANTLTEIATPRRGWSSVTNLTSVSPGQNEETNDEMRVRRDRTARAFGKTTLDGVWAALSDIDQVDEVFVYQNLDTVTDSYSVPGRAMRAYVSGGADSTIAEVLFKLAPIKTDGSTTVNYSYRGHTYPVKFSRPVDDSIQVDVIMRPVSATSPATFPADGEDTVKAAVIAFSDLNQKMGVDAIPQQFAAAANVIDQYYVDRVLLNGVEATMTASMGHRVVPNSSLVFTTVEGV